MGDALRREVERQLREDLSRCLEVRANDVVIDWSKACQEGHLTSHLGGTLEELSGVIARSRSGEVIASGWMDFIHGAAHLPVVVFWVILDVGAGNSRRTVRDRFEIPDTVWALLPDEIRRACAAENQFDARWSKDPKVIAWAEKEGLA